MAGEPDLVKGQSSRWVVYLQQLLHYHGVWDGGEDGAFTDELEAAVQRFQQHHGVTANGAVRADTWAALTATRQAPAHQEPAQHHDAGAPDAGTDASAQGGHGSGGLHGTGAHATEVPASFEVGGLPAFRFNFPRGPSMEAAFDTPIGWAEVKLTLTGSVTVTFPHAPQGISTTMNDQSWRVAATHSLHGITEGVRISGLGTENVSLGATFGHDFTTYEARFTPPNTMSFLGSASFEYDADAGHGITAHVAGAPGFQLDVTITPHAGPPEITDEKEWHVEYGPVLVALGVVALVAVVIFAPEALVLAPAL